MTERHMGDDDEEQQDLSDTPAELTQQSRDAGESLADTEAEITVVLKDATAGDS